MLLSMVLFAFATSPLGLLARREPRALVGWGLALLPFALFVVLCTQIPTVVGGPPIVETLSWVPALGLELRFSLDGLSLLFGLIITGIGTLIVGYAGAYMEKDIGLGRFLVYMFLFMGAMLGVVLAGNVLTMFVFWELTSVTSYLLIGYKHDYPDARRGAQHSLLVTGFGGLALLVGLLMLGAAAQQVGVPADQAYNFDTMLAAGSQIAQTSLYGPAMAFVFLGAFTKSAQFPFHFWLPGAMQAPTPASAFLHSATMVKAGVYLLARMAPGFGDTPIWNYTLVAVGGFTFAFGAFVAFRQYDIKALLAYTTLSQLGGLVLMIGLGGKYGAEALVTLILAHALYKSALFMTAGIIDHETGTRDLNRLGELRRLMPRTMVIVGIALLSQMGIPIMLGFVAKEWALKAALESNLAAPWPMVGLAAIMVAAICYIIAAWRFFKNAFLGTAHPDVLQRNVHDPKLAMLISPAIPALLSILLPFALPLVSTFLSPAASAVYGQSFTFDLYLYGGINQALLLSLGAIVIGGALATQERRLASQRIIASISGAQLFDRLIEGMLAVATGMTRQIQSGRLRTYVLYTVLAFFVFVGIPFIFYGLGDVRTIQNDTFYFYEVVVIGLIPVGVIATITARSRLGAIIAVSMVGAMMALVFVLFSAADLALTQLLIEVLSTVFLLFLFSVMPARFRNFSPTWVRWRDAVIAVCFGVLMSGLVLASVSTTLFQPLAPYYLEQSVPGGKGANVVNVILVDFRSLDTLGEIVVLFVAVLAIFGLLRFRKQRNDVRPSGRTLQTILPGEAGFLTGNAAHEGDSSTPVGKAKENMP
ncbi:hydrogen gas-evolving membrane-bound hydrogenase subunit E [Candidatus Viridilinea mediisalina]|uniref:Electron transport complex protein RnfD n=1 Tax=Candidatus Viridilinea mediisalina TaxID=2024553 RepID=A0A2A6RL85_9CHLR|nr:hydrogen gas-evolving membrane-bound hydrogenase subunit E [Candidatus Viridilinea mediisalina]PDW03671.1 electron transport complex protein RnfD [Candidatus Viridilinea mediisalina]